MIDRLEIVVAIAIALICRLLFTNRGMLTDMLLSARAIPMAWIRALFALCATGMAFSVQAATGFAALFGISAMDGIIVLTFYHAATEAGSERTEAVPRTCQMQMRPVLIGLFSKRAASRDLLEEAGEPAE